MSTTASVVIIVKHLKKKKGHDLNTLKLMEEKLKIWVKRLTPGGQFCCQERTTSRLE